MKDKFEYLCINENDKLNEDIDYLKYVEMNAIRECRHGVINAMIITVKILFFLFVYLFKTEVDKRKIFVSQLGNKKTEVEECLKFIFENFKTDCELKSGNVKNSNVNYMKGIK